MAKDRDDWVIGNFRLSGESVVHHVYNRIDARNGPTVYLIQAVSLRAAEIIADCLNEYTV